MSPKIGATSTTIIRFPAPILPRFELIQHILVDAVSIALIAYVIQISMAQLFAKKHHYKIHPHQVGDYKSVLQNRQEWYASGTLMIVGSFFHIYPSTTSLSRTAVSESSGVRTQLAMFFTALLLFFVILFCGPGFYHLPMCILASIIMVALKGLIMQVTDIPKLWRVSKKDAVGEGRS